jgi:hypothetical protein
LIQRRFIDRANPLTTNGHWLARPATCRIDEDRHVELDQGRLLSLRHRRKYGLNQYVPHEDAETDKEEIRSPNPIGLSSSEGTIIYGQGDAPNTMVTL